MHVLNWIKYFQANHHITEEEGIQIYRRLMIAQASTIRQPNSTDHQLVLTSNPAPLPRSSFPAPLNPITNPASLTRTQIPTTFDIHADEVILNNEANDSAIFKTDNIGRVTSFVK